MFLAPNQIKPVPSQHAPPVLARKGRGSQGVRGLVPTGYAKVRA